MKSLRVLALFGSVLTVGAAQAAFLDFEGLGNFDTVEEFYNGGTSGQGYSGVNQGISFSPNALSIIDSDAGGGGNIGNEPTPDTVLFFLDGSAATMNVAAGFDTGFSFYYTNVANEGFVSVYDGLNGTGNLLATLNLPALGAGPGDPNGDFSNWAAVGVSFDGIAKSVDFGGSANYIAFDNVTLGDSVPVPEPATMFALAGGLAAFAKRRRK
jgi:hypothetical protein